MFIRRNLLEKLCRWSSEPAPKPMLILGAEQVGKTTLVKTLAKKFDQVISVNLSESSERKIFERGYSPEELRDALFFCKEVTTGPKRTLLFLDEIHLSAQAMQAVAGLSARCKDLLLIATSSVITTEIGQWIHHPSKLVNAVTLHPCSFAEYLDAIGEPSAIEAYHEVPVPTSSYAKLLRHFHLYMLIGGMPEVLGRFCEEKHLTAIKPIYEKILVNWNTSLASAFPSAKSGLLQFTLQNSFPFAATRIKFHCFGNSEFRSREMGEAFRILEQRQLIKLIYPATTMLNPLLINREKSPRLQLLDTGMVNHFSGIQKQLFQSDDMNALFHGQIARQAAGQELLAAESAGDDRVGFWVRNKPQSRAEVDFVISHDGMLIPVEVKSGEPGSLRSLHQFVDHSPHPFAIRLHAGELSIRQTQTISGHRFYLLSLPYFLAGRIVPHLDGFIRYVNSSPARGKTGI